MKNPLPNVMRQCFAVTELKNRDENLVLVDEGNASMKLLHPSNINGRKTTSCLPFAAKDDFFALSQKRL